MKQSVYLTLLSIAVLNSCTAEPTFRTPKEKSLATSTIKRLSPIVSYETLGDMGAYESMLDTSMNTVYIHEMRMDQKKELTYRGIEYHNVDMENPREFKRKFKINGVNPFDEEGKSQTFFNRTLRFSCGDEVKQSTCSEEDDYMSTRSIHITSPDINQAEQNTPLCYAGDFVVRWDCDSTNVNGIVIGVRWSGTMIFGDDYPDSEVVCLETFPDTGSATLSMQMFSSIPDTAYCQLILLRGNFETISLDNYLVRIISESTDVIKFVLIKNISYQTEESCEG